MGVYLVVLFIFRLKTKIASKYNVPTQPRLVDIIAAVPTQYKKILLPKLKAKPVRTASGVCIFLHFTTVYAIIKLFFFSWPGGGGDFYQIGPWPAEIFDKWALHVFTAGHRLFEVSENPSPKTVGSLEKFNWSTLPTTRFVKLVKLRILPFLDKIPNLKIWINV